MRRALLVVALLWGAGCDGKDPDPGATATPSPDTTATPTGTPSSTATPTAPTTPTATALPATPTATPALATPTPGTATPTAVPTATSTPVPGAYIGGWPQAACANSIVPTGEMAGDVTADFLLLDQFGDQVRLYDFCNRAVLLVSAAFW